MQEDPLNFKYPQGESYKDLIDRVERVIFELERTSHPILVMADASALRCLYGYFIDRPLLEIPTIPIPQHELIKLTPGAYSCKDERFCLLPDHDDGSGSMPAFDAQPSPFNSPLHQAMYHSSEVGVPAPIPVGPADSSSSSSSSSLDETLPRSLSFLKKEVNCNDEYDVDRRKNHEPTCFKIAKLNDRPTDAGAKDLPPFFSSAEVKQNSMDVDK